MTRFAFATSQVTTGALGGLAGADALCNLDADAGGLGGTWKAWLSDSRTSALTRIDDVGPWFMAGTAKIVAVRRSSLVVQPTSDPGWRDQNGNLVVGAGNGGAGTAGITYFWTGVGSGGATGETCMDWSSAAPLDEGTVVRGGPSTVWELGGSVSCAGAAPERGTPLRLLCLQQ